MSKHQNKCNKTIYFLPVVCFEMSVNEYFKLEERCL